MTTVRNVTKRAGFSMPWATAQDGKRNGGGLTFEARGVMAYLLSKPDDWIIQIEDLMAEGGIGRDKVKNILKELRDAKYLLTEMRHDENGRFVGKTERLHEVAHRDTEIQYYGDRDTEKPSNGKSSERTFRPIHNKDNTQKKEKIAAEKAGGTAQEVLTPEQLFDEAVSKNKQTASIIPFVVEEEKPKARARRPYFDLIVELFGVDYDKLTDSERSGIGKVEAQLKKTGRSLDDVRTIFKYCEKKFTDFKWHALTSNAAMALKGKSKSAPVHIEATPEPVVTDEQRRANVELMRASRADAFGGKAAS